MKGSPTSVFINDVRAAWDFQQSKCVTPTRMRVCRSLIETRRWIAFTIVDNFISQSVIWV
ncbi:hypothetical protein CEXT_65621, partial [Caerostris extrusa]